jgi:hypothetical protein
MYYLLMKDGVAHTHFMHHHLIHFVIVKFVSDSRLSLLVKVHIRGIVQLDQKRH